jgi:adenylosuccinate synthase
MSETYEFRGDLENKPALTDPTVTILVGAQWGDEGKGKWVDILGYDSQFSVRYQGGNNAGHTLYIDGKKVVLHQIPSGVFHPGNISVLSCGVVINPVALVKEMAEVQSLAEVNPSRVWISGRAHLITPWHIECDRVQESRAEVPIGTTKRGIGPAYADKASRISLRMEDYVQPEARSKWLEAMAASYPGFALHLAKDEHAWHEFEKAAAQLKPYVCEAEQRLRYGASLGKKILLEGAQGTLLDINHGTYPFVTSSNTTAGGAIGNLGISHRSVRQVIGIAKAYVTRVGGGPFPTELLDETGEILCDKGREYGATTGRKRRCGWFDAVAMRYAAEVNGIDGLFLNKMDILAGLPQVKICVAYEHPTLGRVTHFPSDLNALGKMTPVYETFPGWKSDIKTTGRISELPKEARDFIARIEKLCGLPILKIGTGPGREDYLSQS